MEYDTAPMVRHFEGRKRNGRFLVKELYREVEQSSIVIDKPLAPTGSKFDFQLTGPDTDIYGEVKMRKNGPVSSQLGGIKWYTMSANGAFDDEELKSARQAYGGMKSTVEVSVTDDEYNQAQVIESGITTPIGTFRSYDSHIDDDIYGRITDQKEEIGERLEKLDMPLNDGKELIKISEMLIGSEIQFDDLSRTFDVLDDYFENVSVGYRSQGHGSKVTIQYNGKEPEIELGEHGYFIGREDVEQGYRRIRSIVGSENRQIDGSVHLK